ncbi:MAG TPA: YCF48-related protein, partial [Ignavibacteriaceae bacterium]|nr:YCF48-related protein [Ignavibacteriaceae bacterium]
IFLLLLINQLVLSQWTNQNIVPDYNDLWSTFFADDSTGWIVGSGGFIKKTTNAGNEWILQNSGTDLILKDVHFADKNTGWICGESGLLLKTTNGGTDWFSLMSGTTEHLTDIQFCTSDIGYVSGFGGTILKTTDGGLSWISLNTGTTKDLYAIDFVDELIGYAVGGGGSNQLVLKTTDGGISWIDKSSEIPFPYGYLLAVDFIDADIGFVGSEVYGTVLYKTTDGGDNWVTLYPGSNVILDRSNSKTQFSPYPISMGGINSMYFKDENNGWILSAKGGLDNFIASTTNGGATWETNYFSYSERPFLSIFVTQNGTGWAVGRRGSILLKENDGPNWTILLSGIDYDIYSIHFFNESIGWVGAYRHTWDLSKGPILKTTNGGKIWKTKVENLVTPPVVCVYFFDSLFGFSVGDTRGMMYTTDGGENWTTSYAPTSESFQYNEISFFFINENIGWCSGENYFGNGWVWKSTDGGNTWTDKSDIGGSSVFFINQNVGWVVGDSGILKSTDGGETWTNKSSLAGSYIKFYDSNIGMCVGGESVLVSTDGGETWITKNGPILQAINFNNSTTVWGYTSEGTVYKTTNFGDSWEALNTGLGFGETAFFVNEYTGWVGGMNGTIFKYSVEPPVQPALPVWTNQISVKDAGGTEFSKILTFGQHINATDSLDASLGEYEIPPPPPSSIFDARFNLPTNPQVSSWIDYRDSAETDILWDISFQPGSAGYPITFTWDSTAFPEGTFYLKDRINGSFVNVNMKKQSSYTLTNSGISSLQISFRGLSKTISVIADWNMISVPLITVDMSVNNLFPAAGSPAYIYNNGYLTEDTLSAGTGYWLKFDGAEQIQIYGLTQGDTVSVQEGWNMIGVFEKDIPVSHITSTPPGIITTYYFGYNNNGYYIADTLKSGKGYWIRVTEAGKLNLNGGLLQKAREDRQLFTIIAQDWGRIKIIDNKGKSVTLFAADEKSDLGFYELPPLPPTGIFDARYSSGRLAENLDSKKIIKISSDNYPITIRAEGIDLTVRDIINGELLNTELKNEEELRITNNKITSIEVIGKVTGSLPVSYELYQNYPNPFNPATRIKFAIPKQSQVNLSIYNMLGELVTTLVNRQLNAGYYEYDFKASDYSSGVYIYRLKTEDFIESKKMLLMK